MYRPAAVALCGLHWSAVNSTVSGAEVNVSARMFKHCFCSYVFVVDFCPTPTVQILTLFSFLLRSSARSLQEPMQHRTVLKDIFFFFWDTEKKWGLYISKKKNSGEYDIKQQTFYYENTSITAFTKMYTVVHLLVIAQTCSYSIAL